MANKTMQKNVRRYKNMKDSGVEWIGLVPTDWSIRRVKSHFKIVAGNGFPTDIQGNSNGDYPVCKASDISIAGKFLSQAANCISKATAKQLHFNIVPKNSILMPKIGEAMKKNHRTICTIDCCVDNNCQGLIPQAIDIGYSYYLFLCIDMAWIDNGGTIPCVNNQKLKDLKIPFPSLPLQKDIATYLDAQCSKIDASKADVQLSINEYKALKSSTIFEAVTKGLDSSTDMKDSGVDWIGKIPNHWNATKIGNFVSIRSGITLGKRYTSEKALIARPYLRVANVKADRLALDDVATIMVTPEEAKKYELVPGELLMTEGGDRDKLGRGTIWNGEIPGCLHQNHVFAVHVNEKYMLTKYLDYLTTSPVGREYFDLTAKKTTNLASTNSSTILRFTVPVPPISEQRDIVAMLDTKCKILDEIIQEKEALVRDLDAYKKSLIYEVVTGKRKIC